MGGFCKATSLSLRDAVNNAIQNAYPIQEAWVANYREEAALGACASIPSPLGGRQA
jgi:hypothetical protein